MTDQEAAEFEPVYETADDIPEGAPPGLYKENEDGQFVATFAGGKVFEDVSGLKGVNKKVRVERNTYKRQAAQAAAEREELLAELEELRGSQDEVKGKSSKSEAALQKLQKTNETLTQSLARRTQQLGKKMSDVAIAQGLPEGIPVKVGKRILRGVIRSVEEKNGDFVTKVFDDEEAQEPRMSERENETGDMSLEEFFEDVFPEEYKDYIPGTGASGGGAKGRGEGGAGGDSGGGAGGVHTISDADADNPRLYRAAKEKAAKAGKALRIV